jgi:hypothetical protein
MISITYFLEESMEIGIFDLEVKEKKNQAYMNRAKTGSRGGSKSRKGMNTPYDYLTTKEKKKIKWRGKWL